MKICRSFFLPLPQYGTTACPPEPDHTNKFKLTSFFLHDLYTNRSYNDPRKNESPGRELKLLYYNYNDHSGTSADDTARRRPHWARIVALVLVCAVAGGGAGFGGARLALDRAAGEETGQTPSSSVSTVSTLVQNSSQAAGEPAVEVSAGGGAMSPGAIYQTYVNSTVGITTEVTVTNVFGQTSSAPAAGSGFILTSDGYILTNYHVIENANSITVTLYNEESYTGTLVGGDEDSDVAVVKIDAQGLTPVVLGASSDLRVGEAVCAIGNPLGELTFTLTTGIVSALERPIATENNHVQNMIQTDCAVNAGNSGGPLFNPNGEVVGIVSAKYASSGVEGLGFAIDDVLEIISDLMTYGYVTGQPYLGIQTSTLSDSDIQRFHLTAGAYVDVVAPGSCAEEAGLQAGDVITAMDGIPIENSTDLITAKDNYKAGDTVSLAVYRDGRTLTVSLTFDEKNTQTEAALDQAIRDNQNSAGPGGYDVYGGNGNSQEGGGYYYYDPFEDFEDFFSFLY